MQTVEKRKTWDSNRFRKQHMTSWPRTHPVVFPHVQTDHWAKMKTMVPAYMTTLPTALLKELGIPQKNDSSEGSPGDESVLPPLTIEENNQQLFSGSVTTTRPKSSSICLMPQYRNVYNDRARRGFCYWLNEKKAPTCKAYSFGAYKTFLGLPKV